MLLVKTFIKRAGHKGLGLFAREFIPKLAICWVHDPIFVKLITWKRYEKFSDVQKEFMHCYGTIRNGVWHLCIDDARFTNHSDNPNTAEDGSKSYAIKNIKKGDEITCNYRDICDGCKFGLGFINREN